MQSVRRQSVAAPEGQRRAPVALAGERPVDVAVEPLAEAAVADVPGHPADLLVVRDQPVADGGGADVPARLGVVEDGRVAAPAERVGVADRLARQQQPARLEVRRDRRIGVLHELPRPRPADERAVQPDRLEEGQPLGAAERVVLLAEGGRDVHHARAVIRRHEVRGDDAAGGRLGGLDELRVAALEGERLDALPLARLEERLVLQPDERRAGDAREHDGVALAGQHVAEAVRGEEQAPLAVLDERVLGLGGDGERGVAGQRPGRGRPGDDVRRRAVAEAQRGVGLASECVGGGALGVSRLQLEEDRDARVRRVLAVAEGDLVAGEAGAAARAVRGDAIVAEDQVTVPEPPEDPPAGLDVLVGVGDVRLAHVDPAADAVGHPLPVGDVAEDGLAALLVEGGDAVLLDLALVAQAELALDLEFDGQAVRVPAALPRRAVAAHRLVAGDQVLEDAREDVVHAGRPVRRRRALVEREEAVGRALLDAALEDALLAPELEDLLLEIGEGDARGRRFELRAYGLADHRSSSSRGCAAPRHAGVKTPAPCGTGVAARGTTRVASHPARAGWRRRFTRRPAYRRALPLLTVGAPAEPTDVRPSVVARRRCVRSAARE